MAGDRQYANAPHKLFFRSDVVNMIDKAELYRIRGEEDLLNEDEETDSLTDQERAEKDCQESILLRQCANNMLLAYGIAAIYPRFMGSFMRVGLWDFTFSAAPISLWSIVLYSLLPFAMYLYSVKIKRTSKVMLGYCFWLGIDTGLAMGLSILGFFGAIFGETGAYSNSHPFIIKSLAIAINSFSYSFVSSMYGKYGKSYRLQERTDEIPEKNIFSFRLSFLLTVFLSLSLLVIQGFFFAVTESARHWEDHSVQIALMCVVLAIIFKILMGMIREPLLFTARGAWDGIKTILVAGNDGETADDVREKREGVYVATAMVLLLIMGHLAYAAQGFLLIQLM